MRTKSFILTFLMMMFCSIGFGQSGTGNHWNPDEHQYANNMDVIAIIEIDDVEQKTESLEVGAFCGTELRASSRPMKAPMLENRYIVFLDILGDEDDDLITFKLYDHSQGIELNYVIEKPINFRFGQDPLGSVDAPYVLEFLTPVAKIGDVHYRTLPLAVEAATAGQTVELIADATGAGLKINKNITVDFGGFTYTINQAVGSAGTESQGFQLLKNNTVTLKNGNIAIAEGTNVKWMFNAYANVTLAGLNVNCTNMATPAANEANYVLVVNNGGGATPKVTYNGVNYSNFPGSNAPLYVDPSTELVAEAGLNVETDKGYVVEYADNAYTAVAAVAKIGDVYYRTLPLAVEAATAGQTVELIADATGAGLVINKNITVDFGGFTYTINQAVGSTGTESQGFQLLKNNTVTLQNGYIAIAENTNVKWMFNAYANVTLAGLNVNCTNMATPAANEANYVLVVNNGGGATPTVNYSGVNVTNFPSTNQIWLDPRTTLKSGAGLESSIETEEGYVVVYNNGEYTAIGAVAKIGEAIYPSVAAAVAAAQAGNVIELLVNVTEDVTVNKSVTIDGANFQYTGNISVSGTSTAITVKNVNFVNGTGYAITTNGIKSVTVEDCTVKNYGYGFLYANKSTPTVVVKNVTVEDCNYGFHWVYGTTATLENVTMTNVPYGLYIQNYAGKTINVKNSTISSIAIWEKSAGVQTFKFEGANTVGTLTDSQYAKYVLAEADATLTAPEGANVTSGVNDYVVTYENGVYKLVVPTVKNVNTGKLYDKLQAAIDEASSGDEIEVLKDISFKDEDIFTAENYKVLVYVGDNKNITLNLNEHEIDIDYNGTSYSDLLSVVLVSNGAGLTVEGNGKITFTENSRNCAYMFFKRGTTGYLTINNGTFRMTDPEDSMIYTNGNQIVTIKGGTFILDEVGTRTTGFPLIFNASGNDANSIVVEGGTYNDDVNHQVWPSEVFIKKELALKYNDNDATWTVVPAVAYVTEDGRTKEREVGYATLADAVNPHDDLVDNLVTVLKAHETTVPAIVERDMTIDFASLAITGNVYPVVRIQNDANVTVKNGNITNNDYVFVLGASDGSSAGNLTIESGVYTGTTTVASVTKGLLTINGGEFKVNDSEYGATYMINCIDANYNDDSANVEIYGGKFHQFNPENNAAEGAGTNFCATGYMAEKIECEHGDCYKVIEGVYVAQVGEVKYKTVAAAVAAATAGETVTLIANVTEDVTISKNLTIDGAGKNYTGNISVDNSVNKNVVATVKNVNFVDGTGYAITTNRIKSITVENCTVTNYGYGFLYANKSTPTVTVKNVTVENANCGFHWVYGTTATLENVTMTNVTYGLYIQNYAGKTINVKNSTISSIAIWEKSAGVQTFNFEGANTVGTLSASQYAKYVLAAEGATLTAPEGSTVTTTVDGYKVAYEDGKYCLKPCDYVAAIGGVKYESLQAAIDAAQDGDEIVVLKDIELGYEDAQDATVKTFFNVNTGKTITIDLNGNNVKAVLEGDETVTAFFHISNSTNLTLKDLSDDNTGTVEIESEAYVSTLLCNDGGYLTVENGNYILEKGKADGSGSGGLVYSGQDEVITINGGYFHLGNVGTSANGSPWIFNASGQNTKNIIVNGGTFNDDILHQYYPFEVKAPKEKALQYNEGLWTMVDAVAYVDEQHESGNYYTNEVGYATLEEAVAARKYNENADHVMTVTLLKEIDLGNTTLLVDSDEDYKNSNINFDFAEKDVEGSLTPAIRIQGGANVTIKNGKMNTTGYNFILGASDGSSAGNLTIESGEYHAQTSVVSVTKGHLNITGGEFSVEPYQGNYAYLINCIDANYNNETATVAISGGKFHNWNPENNAAEGAGTNFCASGYGAVETSTGVWEVVPMQGMKLSAGWNWFSSYIDINGEAGLVKLQDALNPYGVQIKNDEGFTQYTEGQGWFGPTLTSVSVKEMYMINMTEDHELQLKGKLVDPVQNAITLEHGWNWIGYQLNQELDLNDALSKLSANNGDFIKTHNGIAQYIQGYGWWGTLTTMKPGVGYMYDNISADDNTLVYSYPEEGAKTELRTNVTSDNNRWVPVSYKYAHNMNIIAVVEGMESENYEVAAFVDGEVRGSARPIYVEPLDANIVFLTIYGDDVEEMTFKCYDLATGEEYDLNNRMNYSDDAVVGSIDNPYLLSRGTTGIGESAMSEVNIYPNPTTTGSEVNLGSVCDTVEVFNALGVKIAEYTNVDAIDALETAGIYVIRITNDGNVQNCRLIVK
ncbi:MAG: right-handed parallel beta-helix repeat-containing protein [Bacteroidales bacterium]|nr:right-handed parallel beta-helix repeat-containing protein [Bacteroidales bacterium]